MSQRPAWQAWGNLLLRSLERNDVRLLAPYITQVKCRANDLLEMGPDTRQLVYFPDTLVACLHGPGAGPGTGPGTGPGIGLVGCEGLVGWSALFGATTGPGYHSCRAAFAGGSAQVIPADRLRAVARASPTLTLALLRFVETFIIQMSRTILSSLNGQLQARVSSWVLMLHDRIEGDEIIITHEELAKLLDVRRASVTDTLHVLEGERALRCTRGRMVVRDRGLLEALAGPAYGASEQAYRATIGPFGKSAPSV